MLPEHTRTHKHAQTQARRHAQTHTHDNYAVQLRRDITYTFTVGTSTITVQEWNQWKTAFVVLHLSTVGYACLTHQIIRQHILLVWMNSSEVISLCVFTSCWRHGVGSRYYANLWNRKINLHWFYFSTVNCIYLLPLHTSAYHLRSDQTTFVAIYFSQSNNCCA